MCGLVTGDGKKRRWLLLSRGERAESRGSYFGPGLPAGWREERIVGREAWFLVWRFGKLVDNE